MGVWLLAAFPGVTALLVLWRGWRRPPARFLDAWQRRFDVEVPLDEHRFVMTRLVRGRRSRAAGAAIGVVISGLPSYMNLIDPHRSSDFSNPLVGNAWLFGAAIGTVLAEVLVVQRPRMRRAALEVRSPWHYTDRRFVIAVYAAVPVAGAGAVASTVIGAFRWWYPWIGVAAAVVAAVGLWVGLRSIVARAALAPEGVARDVDEALRADGALRLTGAAVALAGAGLTLVLPSSASGAWALLYVPLSFLWVFGCSWWWSLSRDVRWSVPNARARALA